MPVLNVSRKLVLLIIAIIAIPSGAIVSFVLLNRPADWISVASWNGQGTVNSTTTEPFTINGTEWRVSWQVGAYNDFTRCYVSVYDADTNRLVVDISHEQQSGEAHFNSTGTFYLKISPHGVLQSWSVGVYQRT